MTIDKFVRTSGSTTTTSTAGVTKTYVHETFLEDNPLENDIDFQNTFTCVNVKDPVNDQDVATKSYVDNTGSSNPTSDIDFQNTYTCINVKDPVNDQDVATKSYVDSTGSSKAYITVTAERNGALTAGAADFSFGSGTRNNLVGHTMIYTGRILGAGISMYPSYTYATVGITVNGDIQSNYLFSKVGTPSFYKGQTTEFSTPLELGLNDSINFRTITATVGITECVVNLLIELDMD